MPSDKRLHFRKLSPGAPGEAITLLRVVGSADSPVYGFVEVNESAETRCARRCPWNKVTALVFAEVVSVTLSFHSQRGGEAGFALD